MRTKSSANYPETFWTQAASTGMAVDANVNSENSIQTNVLIVQDLERLVGCRSVRTQAGDVTRNGRSISMRCRVQTVYDEIASTLTSNSLRNRLARRPGQNGHIWSGLINIRH